MSTVHTSVIGNGRTHSIADEPIAHMTESIGEHTVNTDPWWWEAAPRLTRNDELPPSTDVAIVGSGYTGLSAALTLLRAGRSVVIVEQGRLGEGASSRNGGMMGSGHKVGYGKLKKQYGHELAMRILQEGLDSLEFAKELISTEQIECDFVQSGRFRGAWKPADYDAMAKDIDWMSSHLGLNASMVSKSEQHREVATDRYHGGCVFHDHASVHPGRFHQGLLARVIEAGAVISCENPALAIETTGSVPELVTAKGRIKAGHIIIATNGYRAALSPVWRRATIPTASFIIRTEPLGSGVAQSLIPGGRLIVETRSRFGYYRLSPDQQSIVFGGRAFLKKTDVRQSCGILKGVLASLFPALGEFEVSHSWTGFVAMTRDGVPHLADVDKGVTVVGGYNGSGVAMAPYLGEKAARHILGDTEGQTVFSQIPLKSFPLYTGNTWFLRPLEEWYRVRDWREGSR